MENKIAWEKYPEGNKREEVFQFAENYRKFLIARQSASALLLLWRKQKRQVL